MLEQLRLDLQRPRMSESARVLPWRTVTTKLAEEHHDVADVDLVGVLVVPDSLEHDEQHVGVPLHLGPLGALTASSTASGCRLNLGRPPTPLGGPCSPIPRTFRRSPGRGEGLGDVPGRHRLFASVVDRLVDVHGPSRARGAPAPCRALLVAGARRLLQAPWRDHPAAPPTGLHDRQRRRRARRLDPRRPPRRTRPRAGLRAGQRLAPVPLTAVVTSPLERRVETSRPDALRRDDGPRHVDDRFGEVRYRDWSGQKPTKPGQEPPWRVVQADPSPMIFPRRGRRGHGRHAAARRDRRAGVERPDGRRRAVRRRQHGDVIKAALADALDMHLDQFERVADPASRATVPYTARRPFVVRLNDAGGDLAPAPKPRRKSSCSARPDPRARRRAVRARSSDAAVGGGAGPQAGDQMGFRYGGSLRALRLPDGSWPGTAGEPGDRTFYLEAEAAADDQRRPGEVAGRGAGRADRGAARRGAAPQRRAAAPAVARRR